jgi:hypothetical protein
MLAALAAGTQCVAVCAAADCSGTAQQHSHCRHHPQQSTPGPGIHFCAYLPAGQAVRTTATAATPGAIGATAAVSIAEQLGGDRHAAAVDTGPPGAHCHSSSLVLKI